MIEFDARGLRIRKNVLGWERISEHRIEDCSALELNVQGKDDHYALQCKAGWRTVRFAQYVSEDQANEILSALRSEMPDIARKLEAVGGHFTTLGLNSNIG
jgi:hypothetical protein